MIKDSFEEFNKKLVLSFESISKISLVLEKTDPKTIALTKGPNYKQFEEGSQYNKSGGSVKF